jgi:hypothetical protein
MNLENMNMILRQRRLPERSKTLYWMKAQNKRIVIHHRSMEVWEINFTKKNNMSWL